MMTKDKERDDAMIAEKERLADILEKKAGNAYYAITSVDLRQAAALLRGDEQPKPDRAEEKSVDTSFQGNRSPTHRCKVCGVLGQIAPARWKSKSG